MIKFSAAVARMFTMGALIAVAASAAQHDYPNKRVRPSSRSSAAR